MAGMCECQRRHKAEGRTGKENGVKFGICLCSSGCQYCAERNLGRTDWVYK